MTLLSSLVFAASVAQAQPASVKVFGGTLSGTLELPTGSGPFPVALIVAGSGPVDRDGNSPKSGLQTDCYKLLAEALAGRGIASLRYDKRGVAEVQAPPPMNLRCGFPCSSRMRSPGVGNSGATAVFQR